MALHDVSAEAAVHRGGPFEVDTRPHRQLLEARAVQCFGHHIGTELSIRQHFDHRQAHTVDRDRVAVTGVGGHHGAADDEPRRIREVFLADDFAQFFDDSGEHNSQG